MNSWLQGDCGPNHQAGGGAQLRHKPRRKTTAAPAPNDSMAWRHLAAPCWTAWKMCVAASRGCQGDSGG